MIPAERVILLVRGGPLAFSKAILAPSDTVCVGRNNLADLALPHDARMSAKHFTVHWDGERCVLRDLESAAGTWLGGERVVEAEVEHGGWIEAGSTHFRVYFEARTPPRAPYEDDARGWRGPGFALATSAALAELVAARDTGRDGRLFAVVDASRGPRPLRLLREAVDHHESLYQGAKGEALEQEAPYLVALRPDSGLLERLIQEGWGARWGIFLACSRPFKDVRQHLRRFLIVEDDDTGERSYFRYYDPRALRIFLPSCTPRQRAEFFGEVACFFAEGARGELCRFSREPLR